MSDLHVHHELELAELQFNIHCLEADINNGKVPSDAHRGLLPHEIDSKVNFLAISDETNQFGDQVSKSLSTYRDQFLALLTADLLSQGSTQAIFSRLQQIPLVGIAAIPGVVKLLDDSQSAIKSQMLQLFRKSSERIAAEAAAQNVTIVPSETPSVESSIALDVQAKRIAQDPHLDAFAAMANAGLTESVVQSPQLTIDTIKTAGDSLSTKSLVSYSRQAASSSIGLGRTDAIANAPVEPDIFASELLDSHTCDPCQRVDGKQYQSIADLKKDYPFGIYVKCLGLWLCRGTPVYVYRNLT